ncbi:hypothetical protein ACLOJK_029331 [Asimina triloba]
MSPFCHSSLARRPPPYPTLSSILISPVMPEKGRCRCRNGEEKEKCKTCEGRRGSRVYRCCLSARRCLRSFASFLKIGLTVYQVIPITSLFSSFVVGTGDEEATLARRSSDLTLPFPLKSAFPTKMICLARSWSDLKSIPLRSERCLDLSDTHRPADDDDNAF